MEKEVNFKLVFEGKAVLGEIDASDLAISLLAIDGIIKHSNAAINEGNTGICLRIRATRSGSFEILFYVIQEILNLLGQNKDGIIALKNLIELIFDRNGLIYLIKKLRGRKISNFSEVGDNANANVHVVNEKITVDNRVVKLLKNTGVRNYASKIATLLKKEHIDKVSIYIEGHNGKGIDIAVDDKISFEKLEDSINPLLVEDAKLEISDDVEEMDLKIMTVSFYKGNKWKVKNDDNKERSVSMDDQEFLDDISRRKILFSKGDHLRCLVHKEKITQKNGTTTTKLTIVKVIEHIPPPSNMDLFD